MSHRSTNEINEHIILENILHSSIDIAVAATDLNLRILVYNPAAEKMFGYSAEEVIGKTVMEMHTKENVELSRIEKAIETVRKKGEYRYSIEQKRKAGSRFFESKVTGIWDAQNNLIGFVLISHDITERKKIEDEFLFKTALLQAQSETSLDGILVVDSRGIAVSYNDRMRKMWNIPKKLWDTADDEKLLEYAITQLRKPDEFLEKVQYLYSHKDEKSRDEIELKDGRYFDRYSSPLVDASGKYRGRVWYFRDITESKKMVEKLRASEERFRAIFDSAIDCIFIKDLSSRYVHINSAMKKLFKISSEDIIGKTDNYIFGEKVGNQIQKEEQKVFDGKILIEEPSKPVRGKLHTFHTVKVPLKDKERNVFGLCGIARDITERKKLEENLGEAENKLRIHANELAESNAALRALLKQREKDQKEFENNILSNIKHLIMPYIEKLKRNRTMSDELVNINVIESNLKEIISPFSAKLSFQYLNFTPKEIMIADLIKDGKQDKDIMEILHISLDTIKTHRRNIRKKLGINNKKINLRTKLLSLS